MGLYNLVYQMIVKREEHSDAYKKFNKIPSKKNVEKHKHISYVINGSINKANVLAVGYNHPNNMGGAPVHSEVDALRKYQKVRSKNNNKGNGGKVSIVVARTNGGNSRPCFHCIMVMATLFYARVKHVYYTTDDGIQKETLGSLKNNCTAHISLNNRKRLKIGIEDDEDDEGALEGKTRLKNLIFFAPNRLERSNLKIH